MLAANAESVPVTETSHRSSFFRQSGWLMIANIAGGMMMWAVHFLSKAIGPKEYGIFGVLLAVIMLVPTMPLQMVLAHQTAQSLAKRREGQLAGMIRWALLGTLVLWLAGVVVVGVLHQRILNEWGITNPVGFWLTILAVLGALWQPIFWGVLQGAQNFLWWGWSMIINGVGRVTLAASMVWLLVRMERPDSYAAGILAGVLAGYVVSTSLAAWHARHIWAAPTVAFDRCAFLREAIPPLLVFAAFQFLLTADTMFVKSYFSNDQAGFYLSAGTLSRALMWLVGPLAAVMFPRLVHSAAKAEKSNLMGLVLIGTAVLAVTGAASLSLLGPFIVKIVSGEKFVAVASSILPWYAFAMVPLCVANVLLNNLLAQSSAKAAVPLVVLAVAYGWALTRFHDSLQMVLKTMGVCNVMLLLVCAWFTWAMKRRQPANPSAQSA
jgi:O-antigen/teichoic acid export membrane protein